MKLTKGKITKLYNKKGQSHKRKKNKKKTSRKNKSFRKKRSLNLATRTLKQFKGGDNDETKPLDTSVEPVDISVEPVDISVEPVAQDNQVISSNPPILEEDYDPPANIETYQPQLGNDQQSVDNIGSLTEDTPVSQDNQLVEDTQVSQDNQLVEDTPVSQDNQLIEETPVSQDNQLVEETPVEPTNNTVSQDNQVAPNNMDEEAKQNKQIADAVKLLANTLNIGADVYKPQDGFEAIETASETLSQSGGKKHKTRKFKLTKRNKSTK